MTYINVIGKDIWGPIGWHLIHNFSIHSTNDKCMYILIKTFGYILPCPTCKKHYNYLINDIYVLNKDEMNKKKMIKYLYEIHNIINKNLEKKHKLTFKESIEINKKTKNEKIIYLMIIIYSNLNYKDMSFNEFDKIYNFFNCFVNNYPNKIIRKEMKTLIGDKNYNDNNTPISFKNWFIKKFRQNKIIKKYYLMYDSKN